MKVAHRETHVAAFFDLDGTLVPPPSLEWRFLKKLRQRTKIGAKNYLAWLLRALRLAPQDFGVMRHGNKMYLRGVCVKDVESWVAQGRIAPRVFGPGVERMAWHAGQGHAIVLMSGTLALLARTVAVMLGMRLALRGIAGSIEICATELEEKDGRWTGEIVRETVFGEAKARAVRRFARERGFDLERCYAYADNADDRWMLECVGCPVAVNPTRSLAKIARRKLWPILNWAETEGSPQSTQSAHRRAWEIWEN